MTLAESSSSLVYAVGPTAPSSNVVTSSSRMSGLLSGADGEPATEPMARDIAVQIRVFDARPPSPRTALGMAMICW